MAGKDAPHVLDAQVALDHRLAEVAQRGGDRRHDAQDRDRHEVARTLSERRDAADDQHAHGEADDHPADQALHRLVRADGGKLCPADETTDEEAADVVADGRQHRSKQHSDAVRVGEHEACKGAEHAHVEHAEQGDGDIHHRCVPVDAGQVPEQAEQHRQAQHQRDRRLEAPVGAEVQRADRHDAQEGGRLVADAANRPVELDGGEDQHGSRQGQGSGRPDLERHERKRTEPQPGDDRRRHVATSAAGAGTVRTAPAPTAGVSSRGNRR